MIFFRKLSIKAAVWWGLSITGAFSFFSSLWGLTSPLVLLNESQILYLFSTSAQVIAAIYGLTLTAFVFYMESLNREASSDVTLVQSIEELQGRFYWQLIFISLLVIVSLFLSNAIISQESSKSDQISIVLINSGQSVYGVALVSIVMFICDVIYPHRVEQASKRIQAAIDTSLKNESDQGSLGDFVHTYNQIEKILVKATRHYYENFDFRKRKRISNIRLAESLYKNGQIDENLYGQLRNLISLRNAIIHGAEPKVSLNMVEESVVIRNKLMKYLDVQESDINPSD